MAHFYTIFLSDLSYPACTSPLFKGLNLPYRIRALHALCYRIQAFPKTVNYWTKEENEMLLNK